MGKIVIHAGMWKTGSSSIQNWLGRHAKHLLDEADIAIVKATVEESATVRAELYLRSNPQMFSHDVAHFYRRHPKRRRRLTASLVEQLDHYARSHGTVVISSEALSQPFWELHEDFLGKLNELADAHDVQVAYFVRPQHGALEASWRQSGFRREQSVREFLERECRLLEYYETLMFARDVAPRIDFVPRPYRLDLLHGGNAVVDFAHVFLGVSPRDDMNVWSNPSLPLDMVNALQSAPKGLLWSAPDDTAAFVRIKRLAAGLEVDDSEQARLSRLVLQQTCHERFEPQNRRLIAALGWETDSWVPPVEGDIGEASFERVQQLWQSRANSAELALLHHALARLVWCEAELAAKRRPARRAPASSERHAPPDPRPGLADAVRRVAAAAKRRFPGRGR